MVQGWNFGGGEWGFIISGNITTPTEKYLT